MTRIFRTALFLAATASFAWAQAPAQPPPSKYPPLFKGGKGGKEDPNARLVEGAVKDLQDNFIEGAVVKLKDMKSLQVRSFITKADGKYRFGGLRKDVDYELKADREGKSSDTKTVSVFDSRKEVIINLKLEDKK